MSYREVGKEGRRGEKERDKQQNYILKQAGYLPALQRISRPVCCP